MTVVDIKALARLTERNPLAVAVALSLVIHLGLFGSWQLSKQLGWLKSTPAWLTALTRKLATPAKARQNPVNQERSIPMTFVEVDPDTVTAEPPENAKYYSSKNSKAANPDPKDQQAVKVDGKQDQVVRLMDNEKPKPFPLQPSPTKPTEPLPEAKPKSEVPGDLALVRPRDTKPSDGQVDTDTAQPKERPRTLAAARAQKATLAGQTMKQDGGMSNRGQVSFDTKATPFGDYDLALIRAVEAKWHEMLDEHTGTRRSGKVVVDFVLGQDGYIKKMDVQESQVGEILSSLCQNAIVLPQPYGKWPAEMRRAIGGTTREIRFTFHYYN
jgi:outer membrane biosynthesis protein TonB